MKSLHLTRILIAVFIIVCLALLLILVTNERWSDGDEVHYLLVSSSLLKDGDLVLDNNYENKDYFTHHSNEESPHEYIGRYGELRPAHGILTSIIMTPAYGLSLISKEILNFESNRAFLFFPRLTMLIIHIIFSLVIVNFLRNLGFSKNISLLCVILFLIQLPVVIYSQAIYSDLIAGYFIMTGAFGILLFVKYNRYKWLILASIFLGLTGFLHSKLIVISGFLILSSFIYLHYIFVKNNSFKTLNWFKSSYYRKTAYSILAPWLFLLIANVLMKYYWFGSFYLDGRGNIPISRYLSYIKNVFRGWLGQWLGTKVELLLIIFIVVIIFIVLFILSKFKKRKSYFLLLLIIPVALAYPFRGWLGQWLDIETGLISNAPLLALIFPGLFIWFRKQKSSFLLIVPATLAYLFLKSSSGWYPGFCPPARYLLPSIPILLPGLCWVLWLSRKLIWLRWTVGALTFLSLLLSSLIPFVGRMGLPYDKAYNIYWRTILNYLKLGSLEPLISLNFLKPEIYDYLIGTGIFILLLGSGYYLQRKVSKLEKIEQNNN